MGVMQPPANVDIRPLTPDRWDDLAALFETSAVTRGCWCMWFRRTSAEFRAQGGDGNRSAMKDIVEKADVAPGLLAYVEGAPMGWCAVAPREEYPRILRSNTVKPIDETRVWSIVCFFVASKGRGRGVSKRLLKAAVDFAAEQGARVIEAYPIDPAGGRVTPDEAYYGVVSTFAAAGFREVARRHPKRPIMRLTIS